MALFTVKLVISEDVDGVMNLLKRTFFIDEPLNEAIGLCNDDSTCLELSNYCKESLLEGLSFKAVDGQGNVVGVLISGTLPLKEADDDTSLLSQAERCKNPKFQKILYIVARREEQARLWEMYPRDRTQVEIKIAATDPSWRRKGIMNALVAETEKAVTEKNVRLLRMDTSSAYSAKSAERFGFKCVYKALYTDIKMDGQPLIVPKPPHIDDRVYIKELFQLDNQ